MWIQVKKISIVVLIASVAVFATIALLAVWEIIDDNELVYKSLISLFVVGFTAAIGIALSNHLGKNGNNNI